jgi:Spy/CpxP family protein refolding chaperone
VAVLLSLPVIALAGPGFRHGFKRGFGGPNPVVVKKFLKDAGCSDQQIRRIETLKDEVERKTLDIKHQVENARLDMKQLMQAENPDRAAIFKQIDKIGALRLQMKKARVGLMLDIRKELTPEQWEKLQAFKTEHRMKHRKQMRQRMQKPMPAPQQ